MTHWLVGLASAASLVLVVGLAWHMRTMTRGEPTPVNRATPSPQAAATPAQARRIADTTNTKPAEDAVNRAKRHAMVGGTMDSVAPPAVSELAATAPAVEARPSLRSTEFASDKARAARSSAPAAPMTPPLPAPPQKLSAAPVAAPPPAPPAPSNQAAAAKITANTAVDAKDTPAQERNKIQKLFMQGRDDEAHQRLRDFRRAHPKWPLPPALQAQLSKP